VKALRYYDEMGLIKPAHVDRFTGYRYYSADQLPRLNRILALKDLGLTLEQIARLLDNGLTPDQIRGMLKLKRAEVEQAMQEDEARLARIEARLRQIEQEGKMPAYDVVLKKLEPQMVAGIRDIAPAYNQQDHLWGELMGYLEQNRAQVIEAPCVTIYYDEEYRERDVDVEVCAPVQRAAQSSGRVKVHELPATTMACVVHHGAFNTLNQAYSALSAWVQANGYRIAGPGREVYLETGKGPVHQDDPTYVTEVQFPVEKA
jgi:effector-binding domain-containing protein